MYLWFHPTFHSIPIPVFVYLMRPLRVFIWDSFQHHHQYSASTIFGSPMSNSDERMFLSTRSPYGEIAQQDNDDPTWSLLCFIPIEISAVTIVCYGCCLSDLWYVSSTTVVIDSTDEMSIQHQSLWWCCCRMLAWPLLYYSLRGFLGARDIRVQYRLCWVVT